MNTIQIKKRLFENQFDINRITKSLNMVEKINIMVKLIY